MDTACVFCGKRTDNAADAGWEPFYGDLKLDQDINGPACPECCKEHLRYDEREGYYLKD